MQFHAAFIKLAQTFPFFLSKTESEIFSVIAMAKIVIEIFLLADQVVDLGQVFIAQRAQTVCDQFYVDHFRPNQPKGVDERKTRKLVPLLAEVPKVKFVLVLLSEANRLIADEQACAPGSNLRCR